MSDTGLYPHGVPIAGPIELDPSGRLGRDSIGSALTMLNTAVTELEAAGIVIGAYDRQILRWLSGWDQPTIAVIASLLHRAVHAPPPPGDNPG